MNGFRPADPDGGPGVNLEASTILRRLAHDVPKQPPGLRVSVRAAMPARVLLAHGHSVRYPLHRMDTKKKVAKAATVKDEPASQEAKQRPLKTFREEDVSVSIWARDRESRGEKLTFYSMTFERSWRDQAGQFRYSKYLNFEDMPKVAKLAKAAQEYVEPLLYPELRKAQ